MSIFNTVSDLQNARLEPGQNVKTRGFAAILDNGHSEYFIQTLAEFGGVPPVGTTLDVELANGNIAVKLSAFIIPFGGIILWFGAVIDIPLDWALCDGTNSTPDLRDSFIIGAGGTHNPDDTGGSSTVVFPTVTNPHTITVDQMPAHTHATVLDHKDPTAQPVVVGMQRVGEEKNAAHALLQDSTSTGGGLGHQHVISPPETDSNLPPFYALAYIMFVGDLGQRLATVAPEGIGRYPNASGTVLLDAEFGVVTVFDVTLVGNVTSLSVINLPTSTDTAYGCAIKITGDGVSTVEFSGQFNFTCNTPPDLTTFVDNWDWIVAISTDQGTILDAELSIAGLD